MRNACLRGSRSAAVKLPRIDLRFWFAAALSAALGYILAQFLTTGLELGWAAAAAVLGVIAFNVFVVQMRSVEHVPSVFWCAVIVVSAAATLGVGSAVDRFGLAPQHVVGVLSLALAATLASWHSSQTTLALRVVFVARSEIYYWLALLQAFALGAAMFELATRAWQPSLASAAWGYGGGLGLMVLSHMVLPRLALPAYWLACALAWPLGISVCRWLAQSVESGGLGWGVVATASLFMGAIILSMMVRRYPHEAARRASRP